MVPDKNKTPSVDEILTGHFRAFAPGEGGVPAQIGGWTVQRFLGRDRSFARYVVSREDVNAEGVLTLALAAEKEAGAELFWTAAGRLIEKPCPGVVPILDRGHDATHGVYTVRQWIDGMPIDRWLAGKMPPQSLLRRLITDLVETMAFCHGRGLVHGNLGPHGILVDDEDQIQLIGFGEQSRLGTQGLVSGPVYGHVGYLAPERFNDDPIAPDPRLDVWQIGALIHYLVSGAPPAFQRSSEAMREELVRIKAGDYRLFVKGPLKRVVETCLKPDPADRFTDARQLLEAWAAVEKNHLRNGTRTELNPVFVPPTPPATAASRGGKALAAAALVAGSALGFAVGQNMTPDPDPAVTTTVVQTDNDSQTSATSSVYNRNFLDGKADLAGALMVDDYLENRRQPTVGPKGLNSSTSPGSSSTTLL